MKTKNLGTALDNSVADIVANAMKDWAVEKELLIIHIGSSQ